MSYKFNIFVILYSLQNSACCFVSKDYELFRLAYVVGIDVNDLLCRYAKKF